MERQFDWPAIGRASAIIFAAAAAFGLLAPVIGAVLVNEVIPLGTDWTTLNISGSFIYMFLFWAIAWAVTFIMGQWMINIVHERIIDDMIATALVTSIMLIVLRIVIWLIYEPTRYDVNLPPEGVPRFFFTEVDAGGVLFLFLVAFLAARVNQY
ncbi:MAG: hypothetical protein GYB64_09770 [Chloroflexi bacterium]|nr:hypothetical protein [Chloroflexota bacterium]